MSYELGDEAVMTQVAGDGDLQLPVDFTMRLRGFDRRAGDPAHGLDVRPQTATTCSSPTTATLQIDAKTGWTPAPWDLTHIEVRRSGGILAIFDEDTVDARRLRHERPRRRDRGRAAATSRSGRGSFVAYGTSDVSGDRRDERDDGRRHRPASPSRCSRARAARSPPTASS